MNTTVLQEIFLLAEEKEKIDRFHTWSQGSKTYIEGMKDEIKEVEEELQNENLVYLEDELGDVLWDYFNTLVRLEQEGRIDAQSVFDRCYKKYGERIETIQRDGKWAEIKKKQKEELRKEQEMSDRK